MLINQTEKIYLGNQEAQKVYLGSRLVWELKPVVLEATFTLVGRHLGKPQYLPYISIGEKDFTNFGVDPNTVTAITVNGERYDVTIVEDDGFYILLLIENANSLTLNGRETLTIHYRA